MKTPQSVIFDFFILLVNLGSIPDVESFLHLSGMLPRFAKRSFYIWNAAKICQEIEEVEKQNDSNN
jgi:hypothetical protein